MKLEVRHGATGAVVAPQIELEDEWTSKRARDFVEEQLNLPRGQTSFFIKNAATAKLAQTLHRSTQKVKNALKGADALMIMPRTKKRKQPTITCSGCKKSIKGKIYRSRRSGYRFCETDIAALTPGQQSLLQVFDEPPKRYKVKCVMCDTAVWGDLWFDPRGYPYCDHHANKFGEDKLKYFIKHDTSHLFAEFDRAAHTLSSKTSETAFDGTHEIMDRMSYRRQRKRDITQQSRIVSFLKQRASAALSETNDAAMAGAIQQVIQTFDTIHFPDPDSAQYHRQRSTMAALIRSARAMMQRLKI